MRIIPKCSAARKAMRGKPLYVYRNWRWGTEMPEKKSRSRYDHEEQSSFGTKSCQFTGKDWATIVTAQISS